MMTAEQQFLPKWILIVSGLFAIMELIVSVQLCLAPESVLETVDLTAKGVQYVVYMWAARQFALGIIFAFAAIKKSAPMLIIAYIFFLVMFMGDFFIGFTQNDPALSMSAVVMCIVSAVMIYIINKKK